MRISDWSSDVCSSDLLRRPQPVEVLVDEARGGGIGGIKTEVGGNIHETERQLALQRLHVVAKQPVERDGAAELVAVHHGGDHHVRAGPAAVEAGHVEIGSAAWRERVSPCV